MSARTLLLSGILALVAMGFSRPAVAVLITSSSSLTNPSVVDFSQFSGTFIFTTGPIEIGDLVGESIIWQTNQPSGTTVIGDPSFGLGNNGLWDSGRNGYTALNLETGHMDYLFTSPVSGVGGFMSYGFSAGNPEPNPSEIIALDQNSNPLESHNIFAVAPIITAIPNDGAFRGIKHATNDIYGFRITNSFIVLDDLTFERTLCTSDDDNDFICDDVDVCFGDNSTGDDNNDGFCNDQPPIPRPLQRCQKAIGQAGMKFMQDILNARRLCLDRQRKAQLSLDIDCREVPPIGDPRTDKKLSRAETKLNRTVDRSCGGVTLESLRFPGMCPDPDGPPFSVANLQSCLFDVHTERAEELIDYQYPE